MATSTGPAAALRRELASLRARLGSTHPQTLHCMFQLAMELSPHGGGCDESMALLREAHAGLLRVHGPLHEHALTVACNLGEVLRVRGQLEEAAAVLAPALAGCRAALGEAHPITQDTTNNFANVLMDGGLLAEAEPLLRSVLAASRATQGPDHPDTLTSAHNLGKLCWLRGTAAGGAEAEALFCEALAGRRRVLGPRHPDTLSAGSSLGNVYTNSGRLDAAEAILGTVVPIRRGVAGCGVRVAGCSPLAGPRGRRSREKEPVAPRPPAAARCWGARTRVTSWLSTTWRWRSRAKATRRARRRCCGRRWRRSGARWGAATPARWGPSTTWPRRWSTWAAAMRRSRCTARRWRGCAPRWATATPTRCPR